MLLYLLCKGVLLFTAENMRDLEKQFDRIYVSFTDLVRFKLCTKLSRRRDARRGHKSPSKGAVLVSLPSVMSPALVAKYQTQ